MSNYSNWRKQGSRKCGSTGAALLGNGRPNWGNDANWGKKKRRKGKDKGQKGNKEKLITCVIVRSNPRRLLPIWREKLRGHYHVTMTFDNDFCVWRWHYRERHLRVSVNAQTIARNAPRIRALITSRDDRHVWTDRNSFTGISTEMIKMLFYLCFCQKNTHKNTKLSK